MKNHVDTVGIILLTWGALQIGSAVLTALIVALYSGMGAFMAVIGASQGDDELMIGGVAFGGFMLIVMAIPLLLIALTALATFIGGYGVLKRRPWARIVSIVGGALSIMQCFPVGALVGVFTIIVLLDAEVTAEFAAVPADPSPW